ncbi:hypothetical protein [Streptomyces sp. NPDC004528]|uniref:hypothetical protein n=1 Tax=Streptomyces sp. NPDC004528 TaxID=3154550 RepID=UPI0033B2D405
MTDQITDAPPAIPDGPVAAEPAGFYMADAQYKALTDTLTAAGIELGEYDARIAAWLAKWEWGTVAVIASWVARAAASRPPEPAAAPSDLDAAETPSEDDR